MSEANHSVEGSLTNNELAMMWSGHGPIWSPTAWQYWYNEGNQSIRPVFGLRFEPGTSGIRTRNDTHSTACRGTRSTAPKCCSILARNVRHPVTLTSDLRLYLAPRGEPLFITRYCPFHEQCNKKRGARSRTGSQHPRNSASADSHTSGKFQTAVCAGTAMIHVKS